MSDIRTIVDRELRRHLVARTITCMRTGEVLDVRTAVFLLDADGDPAVALSPRGWTELLAAQPDTVEQLAALANPLTPDPTTIPKD